MSALAVSGAIAALALGAPVAPPSPATAAPAGTGTGSTSAPPAGSTPIACGAATLANVARTVNVIAARIYGGEAQGSEVRSDRAQVQGYQPLVRAMAAGDAAATRAATTTLVYSHTHIVRLRVIVGGHVLADVGGPKVLAPVSGTVTRGGSVLGRFLMSVQDDLGLQLLIARYTGMQSVMRVGSRQVGGAVEAGGIALPADGAVRIHGVRYYASVFYGRAFPSGVLRVWVLVPSAAAPPSGRPCAMVHAAVVTDVVRRLLALTQSHGLSYATFVKIAWGVVRTPILVRSATAQLAGTTTAFGALPSAGEIGVNGRSYMVDSFPIAGRPGVRAYVLVAQ